MYKISLGATNELSKLFYVIIKTKLVLGLGLKQDLFYVEPFK